MTSDSSRVHDNKTKATVRRSVEAEEVQSSASHAIERKPLLTAPLPNPGPIERVEIKQIDLAPAQATGLHRHPCDVVGYVASGSIVYQIEGQPSRVLKAGDAFHEPRNAHMLHFDNASDTTAARFIAFYLLSAGEDRLIEMLDAD